MHLLGSLGIDLSLLFAQIANFALLLVILNYLVYQPLLRRIDADEAALKAADTETKKLAEERIQFSKKQRMELDALNTRVNTAITEAQGIAEEIKRRARDESETEKAAVVKQIKERLKEIEYAQNRKA